MGFGWTNTKTVYVYGMGMGMGMAELGMLTVWWSIYLPSVALLSRSCATPPLEDRVEYSTRNVYLSMHCLLKVSPCRGPNMEWVYLKNAPLSTYSVRARRLTHPAHLTS
jgi:hypothetical protein